MTYPRAIRWALNAAVAGAAGLAAWTAYAGEWGWCAFDLCLVVVGVLSYLRDDAA